VLTHAINRAAAALRNERMVRNKNSLGIDFSNSFINPCNAQNKQNQDLILTTKMFNEHKKTFITGKKTSCLNNIIFMHTRPKNSLVHQKNASNRQNNGLTPTASKPYPWCWKYQSSGNFNYLYEAFTTF
jgi:hypothetical protein